MSKFFIFVVSFLCSVNAARNPIVADITPIPMEFLNPRLTEFRRIDSNNDNSLTFGEFLLSDRPFVESQSRYFHELDGNDDGTVTRNEFEQYFKKRDDEHNRQRIQTDQFFKQLAITPFNAVSIKRNLFGPNQPQEQQIIISKLSNSSPPSQQPIQPQQQST